MKTQHNAPAIAGVYQATSRGFGFFVPADGGEDCFVPPRWEGGAWHGDQVLARITDEDEGEGRQVARVTAVTLRANRVVTGALSRQGRQLWLRPDSDKLPSPIRVTGKTGGARAGDKASLTMVSYGGGDKPPMGTLQQTFGRDGTRAAATQAILYQYDISPDFPQPVLDQAEAVPQAVCPKALAGRLDLREETIITIDGESAKDLDDAVSLTRDSRGRWVLGVHIADVSHYVPQNSPLDQEAWERGTSVYFADQVIPMLPPALSNGICSLNPQVDRLTLSCIMTLDEDGVVVDHSIAKSVIRTAHRMTYADCNALLEGGQPQLEETYADILPMLRDMAALSAKLERRRRLRGSLDLEGSESYICCNERGEPVDIQLRRQGVSEAIIESFMLAANETVAQHLFQEKSPCVYRVHESPSQDKTDALRTMLSPLGYDLREADGFSLQKLLDQARGKPEAPAVSMMVLRALMKARYDTRNLGHFGLAAPYYCHFTSPIRRYPDLMVHRILTALLEGRPTGPLTPAAAQAAVQSSQRELAAQSAEREIEKRYMAEYMAAHLGEAAWGAVSGVTRFGLFVALANGVEGMLPLEALPGGRYDYDEAHMLLSGPEGRYCFGMPLQVVCVRADPGSGQIDFQLAGTPLPAPRAAREEAPPRPNRSRSRGRRSGPPAPKRRGRRHK